MAQETDSSTDQSRAAGSASEDGFVPAGAPPVLEGVEGDQYEELDEQALDQDGAQPLDETAVLATGIDELQNQALNAVEVAKQLEQLTDVVLSSAEVSTRSASVAADVSHDMRLVMESVSEDHKSNVRITKVMIGSMLFFLLIGLGTFFAISTKMQLNIGELDSMSLAVGKRIVDLDATVSAFTQASRSMNELTEKLEAMNQNQDKLESKFDDINKQMSSLPGQVADQSNKALEAKLQEMQKQIQGLETKLQTVSARAAAAPAASSGNGAGQGNAEIMKLRKELETANAKAKDKDKDKDKGESKASAPAQNAPRQEPKPGAKLESAAHEEASAKESKRSAPELKNSDKKEGARVEAKSEKTATRGTSDKEPMHSQSGAIDSKISKSDHEAKQDKESKATKSSAASVAQATLSEQSTADRSNGTLKRGPTPAQNDFVVYPRVVETAPLTQN